MSEKIVEKICKKKGDYVIGLKGNQGEFHSDVALYFSEFAENHPKHSQTEKGHGRVECREYTLCTDIKWLGKSEKWKGLKAVGMVRSNVYHLHEPCANTGRLKTSFIGAGTSSLRRTSVSFAKTMHHST